MAHLLKMTQQNHNLKEENEKISRELNQIKDEYEDHMKMKEENLGDAIQREQAILGDLQEKNKIVSHEV
jgi:hypothetical protein